MANSTEMEFLNINFTRDSSLLFDSPFYWQILTENHTELSDEAIYFPISVKIIIIEVISHI
jgi:hypothetical protein